MKKSENLQTLALAAVLAAAPALLTSSTWAEPAASPPAAQQKQAPTITDADDLSVPQTGSAVKSAVPAGSAAATTVKDVAVGATVFGSDGKKIGQIKGVKSESSGLVQEIHITTGGLFGVGAKTVAIPGSKITKGGQNIQLALTSDEVGKLPALADSSG